MKETGPQKICTEPKDEGTNPSKSFSRLKQLEYVYDCENDTQFDVQNRQILRESALLARINQGKSRREVLVKDEGAKRPKESEEKNAISFINVKNYFSKKKKIPSK